MQHNPRARHIVEYILPYLKNWVLPPGIVSDR